ncbi:hypothetical protein ACUXZZ_41795 [Streptomyces graminifolii]|uniref:hypothetical protein n=1 Tax=Streptomyces graminifolii TaxID=1266771 RepID=UPI004059D334
MPWSAPAVQRGADQGTLGRGVGSGAARSDGRGLTPSGGRGSGHTIQVPSIGGVTSLPGHGLYHASRFALGGFTAGLATAWGTRHSSSRAWYPLVIISTGPSPKKMGTRCP